MKRFALMAVLVLSFYLLTMGKSLEKGQLFLSTQAGVTARNGSTFQLKLDSPISRSFSLGFSFEQRKYPNKVYSLIDPEYGSTEDLPENTYLLPGYSPSNNSQSFSLEAAYHFTFIPLKSLDVFTGLGIGLDIDSGRSGWNTRIDDQGQFVHKSSRGYDFSQQLFTGLNFFITEKIGLTGCFSIRRNPLIGSVSSATLGATFRLK
jgi:hypothetical protein